MCPCFFLPLTSYFSLTLSLCLFTFTRGRGLTLILARFLVRALVDGPSFPLTDMKDHTPVRSPCSRAHFGRVTTACVSSPRDWAVSTGSHMQQGMDISQAPPHLGAPIPLFEFRSRQKTTTQKFGDKNFGDNFPQDMAVLRTLCSACLTPRRAQDKCLESVQQCSLLLWRNAKITYNSNNNYTLGTYESITPSEEPKCHATKNINYENAPSCDVPYGVS